MEFSEAFLLAMDDVNIQNLRDSCTGMGLMGFFHKQHHCMDYAFCYI